MEDMEEMVTITITKEQYQSIKDIGHSMLWRANQWLDNRKWDDPDDGTELYKMRLADYYDLAKQAAWIAYDLKPSK